MHRLVAVLVGSRVCELYLLAVVGVHRRLRSPVQGVQVVAMAKVHHLHSLSQSHLMWL